METKFKYRYRRSSGHGVILFALLLILCGTLYTLFDMEIIPLIFKPVIFSWQMLLIVLGIYQLLFRGNIIWGIIIAGIGGAFLLPVINQVYPAFHVRFYWPLILIIVGVIIIIKQLFFKKKHQNEAYYEYVEAETSFGEEDVNKKWENKRAAAGQSNGDKIEKNVIFSGGQHIVFSQDFQGGEINVIFGELNLDLRKAKLSDLNYLETNVCFGSIVLYVPENWKINIKSEIMFGDVQDKRSYIPQEGGDVPTLNLKAAVLFASVKIRD